MACFRVRSWLSWRRTKQGWCQGQRPLDVRSVAWWHMAHWPRSGKRWQSVLCDWSWEAPVKELGLDKSYGVYGHRINTRHSSHCHCLSFLLLQDCRWLGLHYPLQGPVSEKRPRASILKSSWALFCFLYNIIHSDFTFFTFFEVLTSILMLIWIFKFPDFYIYKCKSTYCGLFVECVILL